MKKNSIVLLACLLALLLYLAGCNSIANSTQNETTEPNGEFTMLAEIVEIADNYFLVRRVITTGYFDGHVQLEVPIANMDESMNPQVGDVIKITYTGLIMETMPARIHEVLKIEYAVESEPEIRVVPSLEELGQYEGADLTTMLAGFTEDQLIEAWGNWDSCLSGLYGDIWYVNSENPETRKLLVYFDQNDAGVWVAHTAVWMSENIYGD